MMAVKILLALLLVFLTLLAGVCPQRPQEIYVKAGEMVALHCPYKHRDAKPSWTSFTTQEMTNNMSSAEQKLMGVLIHDWSLVILNASVNHQGNYSCSLGNASRQYWFRLTVHTTQRGYEAMTTYPQTCYTQESCTLRCPDVNIPAATTPNITSNNIIWQKGNESLPKDTYFSNVEENDHGVYTCIRSYLYQGEIYNMTFTMALDVKPNKKTFGQSVILSPRDTEVFAVDLGSTVVIDCKAVLYSDLDEVFWITGDSFVEMDSNLTVFYNHTREDNNEEKTMTASLFFRNVSAEELSKEYTCKLESVSQPSSFVTITLAQTASLFSFNLDLRIVGIMVTIIVMAAVYVMLKIDIALFLRDTLGCYRSSSDHKSYDAFLMCYESNKDAGLNEDDRKWLESVLEERFGYSLCLYDRDVLPGQDVAEVVLDYIEQSRTVVLVPTSPDPGPGSGLLSAIHEALVERQTRLVFIKTEATEGSRSGSLPEALQLLAKAAACVTWKGMSSIPPSSSFWKQLRYYLPAPQRAPRTRLLPQKATPDDNC